jgi:hypothetical protein
MVAEDTIEQLLTKQALREVLQNYTRSIDRLDRDLMETVFWPDAKLEYAGSAEATGTPKQVIDFFMVTHRQYENHQHLLGNMTVVVNGDTAASETYVTATLRSFPDESGRRVDVVIRGRYLDRWSKRDGLWAIEDRLYISDVYSEYEVLPTEALSAEHVPDRADTSAWRGSRDSSDPSYARFASVRPAIAA